MSAVPERAFDRWSVERIEEVLGGLQGILSAKLRLTQFGPHLYVVAAHGEPEAELRERISASLFVHFGQALDQGVVNIGHVVRFPRGWDDDGTADVLVPGRLVLIGHRFRSRPGGVDAEVTIGWQGRSFRGTATGSDVAHAHMETHVLATLRAIEGAVETERRPAQERISLHLDGTSVVSGSSGPNVLVAINAVKGRESVSLAGAVGTDDNENEAAILATLRATDRWVRGQISS